MSDSSFITTSNPSYAKVTYQNIAGNLNKTEKTDHIVLASRFLTNITLGDFMKAFRDFQETYKHDSSDYIDPIQITETVTKLIDIKCP